MLCVAVRRLFGARATVGEGSFRAENIKSSQTFFAEKECLRDLNHKIKFNVLVGRRSYHCPTVVQPFFSKRAGSSSSELVTVALWVKRPRSAKVISAAGR
jgi:hypothetical protein